MASNPVDPFTELCAAVEAIKQAAIEHGVNDQVGAAIAHAEVVIRLHTYGRTRSGRLITDAVVEELAAKAEKGFDVPHP